MHCRAGKGRTGLVAALLLIETGVAREKVIAIVRASDPIRLKHHVQQEFLMSGSSEKTT